LIDELQICLHPVIAGGGLPLFEDLTMRKELNLIKSKSFASGAVALYYQPSN
jgi:dihydrofolate reductase